LRVYFIVLTLITDRVVGMVLWDVGGPDFGFGWVRWEIMSCYYHNFEVLLSLFGVLIEKTNITLHNRQGMKDVF